MMESLGRVATWLELAVAPDWRRMQSKIRIHAIGGRKGTCYALSMDGRWLCASGGQLTVFRGLESARRFLRLVKVEEAEPGGSPAEPISCSESHYCLFWDGTRGLSPCRHMCQAEEGRRAPN